MKILVTGAGGFIGKNLIAELRNRKYESIYEFDLDTDIALLDRYTKDCEFVFHLAGVNRPKVEAEYMEGNYGFTTLLLNKLKEHNNKSPILFTSSIQAELENPYGQSKKAAEEVFHAYGVETDNKVLIYRLPNVFGKWCKPNYNSVVATFCSNIANNIEIKIKDPNLVMNLVYIDDVIEEFLNAFVGKENKLGEYCTVPVVYTVTLGKLANLIKTFHEFRKNLFVPNMGNELEKKLYSTYISYSTKEQLNYALTKKEDYRGSFTEFVKTPDRGQISINISKPGITKGNHWHHTKLEKFLVVRGKANIQLRDIHSDEIINYHVTGEKPEVVEIPPGFTHNIRNEGEEELITVIWVNEAFNSDKPDTYNLEV